MTIPPPMRSKLDAALAEQLEIAQPTDHLRVICRLRAPKDAAASPSAARSLHDGEGARRAREAFLRGRERAFSALRARLREMGIRVDNEGLLGTLVIAGPAAAITRAIAGEEDVLSAMLDRAIPI